MVKFNLHKSLQTSQFSEIIQNAGSIPETQIQQYIKNTIPLLGNRNSGNMQLINTAVRALINRASTIDNSMLKTKLMLSLVSTHSGDMQIYKHLCDQLLIEAPHMSRKTWVVMQLNVNEIGCLLHKAMLNNYIGSIHHQSDGIIDNILMLWCNSLILCNHKELNVEFPHQIVQSLPTILNHCSSYDISKLESKYINPLKYSFSYLKQLNMLEDTHLQLYSTLMKKDTKLKENIVSDSEKHINLMLDSMGIPYETQKRIGPYVVDFYFPQLNKCLEYDGLSHYYGSTDIKLMRTIMKKHVILSQGVSIEYLNHNQWAKFRKEEQLRMLRHKLLI